MGKCFLTDNLAMLSSVSSSGLFPRGPLPLHPGPTDFWDWLRRRLWRLWCLSQSIKGPSYYHFQPSLLALDNPFFFPLQGPASSPSDGLADLLKMGAGIAQGLMAIFNNKVNFLFFWTLELSDGHLQQQGELSRLPPLRQGAGLHNTQTEMMVEYELDLCDK